MPRSWPVVASTITMSPVFMVWPELFLYIPLRVFLKRTSKKSLYCSWDTPLSQS